MPKAPPDYRPDYVVCIADTNVNNAPWSLCRRTDSTSEFCFVNISHAFGVARDDGYQLICPECSRIAIEQLQKQTWDGEISADELAEHE